MKLETVPPRIRALHTLTLLAFALSQPLLDLLALHTTFLVAHRVGDGRLVALAFAIAVGVPGLLCLAKWAVEHALTCFGSRSGSLFGSKLGWALHVSTLGALVAALALPALKSIPATVGAVLVGAAGVLGLAAAFCYARWRPARALLTVLAPAPLLFAVVFLANPEVRKLRAGTETAQEMGAATQGEAPVVFMLFDALGLDSLLDESGGIDVGRHPNLAAFAQRATWFRNATTVAEMTDYAVPAILTGDYPALRRPPTAAEYPQNLFTALADRYALEVQEGPTRLCPESLCRDADPPGMAAQFYRVGSDLFYVYLHMLLPEDWSERLPSVSSSWAGFASGTGPGTANRPEGGRGDTGVAHGRWADVPWVFDRFLESIRHSRGPTLHFVHLNLPHPPYKYLPSGLEYGPIGSPAKFNDAYGRNWRDDEWAVTQGLQRHLLQVAYADVLVGRMQGALEETGRFDGALIVIAADHGISYRRGMNRRLLSDDGENAADILRIPLFVKVPGQRVGEVSERNAETIDVLPTVVDALGGRLVESVDGVSLFDPEAPRRLRKTVYLWRVTRTDALPQRSFSAVIDGDEGRRRIRERFDTQRGVPGLFAVGRYAKLIGRAAPMRDLEPGDAGPRYSVRLADRDSYDTVDPMSGFVPAQVTGEITGGAGRLDLAVAVGGTIRAVTRTLAERSSRFSAMVPADSFQRGRNDIRIYVIEETRGDVTLVPAHDDAVRVAYTLDRAGDGTVAAIVSSAGERYPLSDRLRGEVTRSTYSFLGRVTDARTLGTADVLLLFAQGVFLHAHEVAPRGPANPGPHDFEFLVPYARLRNVPEDEIAFYALAVGAASQLGYDSGLAAARSAATGVSEP